MSNKIIEKDRFSDKAYIHLDKPIGRGTDCISSLQFCNELNEVRDVKELSIYIHSDGGSAFHGESIYENLRKHRAQKTSYIFGMAGSISSVISLAADSIKIACDGAILIHDPFTTASPSDKLLHEAKKFITDVYVCRTGTSRDDVSRMMASETVFTPIQALEYGFADSIFQPSGLINPLDFLQAGPPPGEYTCPGLHAPNQRRNLAIKKQMIRNRETVNKIIQQRNEA